MHTFVKTRPGPDMHMGALLREALEFQGISVRVDKPWRSVPSVYLVAEREGYTRVWIHAHSCNGAMHYDIPRAELMGVAAVITDEVSTRFVYNGFNDENARPVAQAQALAAAVARHFGMPVREVPDPFASNSGYTDCACRDCMDVTVSSDTSNAELCEACQEAGCERWRTTETSMSTWYGSSHDCQRDDAYGEA